RRRPFVVTRSLGDVPWARVRRAVVDEIELGVVREPSPRRATADLPRFPGPAGDAEVRTAIVRVERPEARADQNVLVGAEVVAAPELLAAGDVDGGEPSAHAHLASAGADEDFVLHHDRRHGNRFPALMSPMRVR